MLLCELEACGPGFQKSAEHVENRQYAEIFNERARERQQAVAKAAAAQAGGTPEDEATMLGAMHRMFVDLKSAITGRDDVAIIKEVERGESYLKEKFETALQNADLSPQARAAVEDAWTSVKSGHDQVSQLKHGLTT